MISTAVMIRLGRVQGNRMVDMQLSNHKLVDRATLMVMDLAGVERDMAEKLLKAHGNVRNAVEYYTKSTNL
jgi:N-acetylmuramic acid 6-phosphate etherase